MEVLKVCTVNVNGFRNGTKRQNYFTYFHDSPYDVILLQETHVQKTDIQNWTHEWGKLSFWNCGPTNKTCGVGILINTPKISHVLETKSDTEGRILTVKLKLEDVLLQIVNIYVPDNPQNRVVFFQHLHTYLVDDAKIIMGGDFNMVEDVALDRLGGTNTSQHKQGLTQLQSVKQRYALVDKWRQKNPTKSEFTWTSPKQHEVIQSRLDRFYIDKGIEYLRTDYYLNKFSDHKFVIVELRIRSRDSNSTYWKLNTQVLSEIGYITHINSCIDAHKAKKATFPTITSWWDNLKYTIQLDSIEYCITRNRRNRQKITEVQQEIQTESDKVNPDKNKTEVLLNDLNHLQHNNRGAQVRSRDKTTLNEEKPTKYFFALENSRQTSANIRQLTYTVEDSTITLTDKDEIRKYLVSYYGQLYTGEKPDENAQNEILDATDKVLTQSDRDNLEKTITTNEILLTIQETAGNKAPGIDGLPKEFYETFYDKLKDDLTELANEIYLNNKPLAPTHEIGIITLKRKEEGKINIENWRPITLLCADYKIITKTITRRLRRILDKILHPNQTCSVVGRQIQSNIYLIRDIISYMIDKRQRTYIISFDFRKAFDTLNQDFLIKTLEKMEFGNIFITFIRNIYAHRSSWIKNNGELSSPIDIKNGILQGCPISLPLFCIAAETLANKIRQDTAVKGIKIPGQPEETKLSQFADDTTLLTQDEKSINKAIEIFHTFGRASGCKLNENKQKGLALVTAHYPQTIIPIKWNEKTGLKTLGVYFFPDLHFTKVFNWNLILIKLEKNLSHMKYRSLSLQAKVMILNALCLSKVWYISILFDVSTKAFQKLERIIFKFLWDDKGVEPIKRQFIYLKKQEGGLGLIHPQHQGVALRLKYFYDITDPKKTESWIFFARYWLARRLPKYNPQWSFLTKNNCAKYNGPHLPLHYERLEDDFVRYKPSLDKVKDKTTKNICDAIKTIEFKGIQPKIQQIWNITLQKNITWKKLWVHNYSSYAVGTMGNVLFKIMHNCLPTRVRLKKQELKRNRNYQATCKYCSLDETTMHIMADCKLANVVWDNYEPVYNKIIPEVNFDKRAAVLTYNLLNAAKWAKKLLLTLTTIILFELWNSRNKFEKENTIPNLSKSIKIINANMNSIVKAHFEQLKAQNNLDLFETKFAIKSGVCELRQGILKHVLPSTEIT